MEREGFESTDVWTTSAKRAGAIAMLVLLLFPWGAAAQVGVRTACGQPGFICTVAGTGEPVPGNAGLAFAAGREGPLGASDGTGNLHIAHRRNYRVHSVDPTGIVATVAETGTIGPLTVPFSDAQRDERVSTVPSTDCVSQSAAGDSAAGTRLVSPQSLAVDSTGELYIADSGNHRALRLSLLR